MMTEERQEEIRKAMEAMVAEIDEAAAKINEMYMGLSSYAEDFALEIQAEYGEGSEEGQKVFSEIFVGTKAAHKVQAYLIAKAQTESGPSKMVIKTHKN